MNNRISTKKEHKSGCALAILYHQDGQNNVVTLTNSSGNEEAQYRLGPWGEWETSTGNTHDNEYGYTGRRKEDDLGLMYYRARYYDPQVGRFISQDKLTRGPDDPRVSYKNNVYELIHGKITLYTSFLQPHQFNRYVYVNNNPIGYTDPLGLISERTKNIFRGVGKIVGGVAEVVGSVVAFKSSVITGPLGAAIGVGVFGHGISEIGFGIAMIVDSASNQTPTNMPTGVFDIPGAAIEKYDKEKGKIARDVGEVIDLGTGLLTGRAIPGKLPQVLDAVDKISSGSSAVDTTVERSKMIRKEIIRK